MAVPPPFDPGGLWDKPSADFKAEYTPANGEKSVTRRFTQKKDSPHCFLQYGLSLNLLRQYRIILSADTASEVRQMLSQKRR